MTPPVKTVTPAPRTAAPAPTLLRGPATTTAPDAAGLVSMRPWHRRQGRARQGRRSDPGPTDGWPRGARGLFPRFLPPPDVGRGGGRPRGWHNLAPWATDPGHARPWPPTSS